jgi:DNA polymerase III sliding clamp (beta) subunit (PCNA family)
MLDTLRFVQGSVAKKDLIPELQHFHIQGGTIRGYNGMLGLCCPIDLNLDVTPNAIPFIKAIQTCKETIQLHVTPAGKLAVKSGKFKAFIDCIVDKFPEVTPEGKEIILDGSLLKVLKKLAPLIAEDASRPWARGILLRGQSAFATNNVILAEHWLGYIFPVTLNIPRAAVLELLRIGEEPIKLQMSETSATFHFTGDRWLRTQTYSTDWPELTRILDQNSNPVPIPEGLWDAALELKPFVGESGRLFLRPGNIATGQIEGEGASFELPELQTTGCFNFEQLQLLKPVAKTIDFSTYPAPCLFHGDGIRGAIIGMRD